MNHSRLWVAAAIIAFFIIAGFVFSVPHTRDAVRVPVTSNVEVVPSVTLHDTFKKGIHTLTGSVQAPNACSSLSVQTSYTNNASSTQGIQMAISLSSDTTDVCLQLPTSLNFQTSIAAPAHLPFSVTVNGKAATITSP